MREPMTRPGVRATLPVSIGDTLVGVPRLAIVTLVVAAMSPKRRAIEPPVDERREARVALLYDLRSDATTR